MTDTAMSMGMGRDPTSLHPAVTVMDFAKGRLIGIAAIYENSYEFLVYTGGSGINKPSLTEKKKPINNIITAHDSTKAAAVLLANDQVTIKRYVHKRANGVLVTFDQNELTASIIRTIRKELKHGPQLGLRTITHLKGDPITGRDQYFIESTATSMLPREIHTGRWSQIQEFQAYLLNRGICLDFNVPSWEIFGLPDEGQVELLNLSALIDCAPPA